MVSFLTNLLVIARSPPRGEKLKQIFGEDAPRHYIDTANADRKPWYLRPSYDSKDILIDPDGTVRGGNVQALVDRLTAHEHFGMSSKILQLLAILIVFKTRATSRLS